MATKTVLSTVIEAEKLQQLQKEIKQEIDEILKHAKFDQLFEKYGVPGDNLLKLKCSIDLTKLAVENGAHEKLAVLSLLANPETEMNVTECTLQWCDDCCPKGCWVCV